AFSGFRLWGVPMYPGEVRGMGPLSSFWARVTEVARSQGGPRANLPSLGPRVDNPPRLPVAQTAMLIFAGKGGVGKTTLACATALRVARVCAGKRFLLFSADPAHSLADCLGVPLGAEPSQVAPGLWALELDANADLAALKGEYRQELAQFLSRVSPNLDLTFDREVMERILDLSPPGIDELMALAAVMSRLAPGGFDTLILDAAPTGHLVRLLELPELVDGWLKAVFGLFLKYRTVFRLPRVAKRLVMMSKDLKRLQSVLHDPARASLFAVSALTEMSFAETQDLLAVCERLAVPVSALFLNMATPDSPDPLCGSVFRRESAVRERFSAAFPRIHQAVVYRQGNPAGLAMLGALGRSLFSPAAGEEPARKDTRFRGRPIGSQECSQGKVQDVR
ncbi:MAG: hypothetical protein B7Z74_03165, partial [Deltaproteobacteria bacterium 21-66-5]